MEWLPGLGFIFDLMNKALRGFKNPEGLIRLIKTGNHLKGGVIRQTEFIKLNWMNMLVVEHIFWVNR